MSRVPEDGRYLERTAQDTTPGVEVDEDGRLSYSTSTGDVLDRREPCYDIDCPRPHVEQGVLLLHADEAP